MDYTARSFQDSVSNYPKEIKYFLSQSNDHVRRRACKTCSRHCEQLPQNPNADQSIQPFNEIDLFRKPFGVALIQYQISPHKDSSARKRPVDLERVPLPSHNNNPKPATNTQHHSIKSENTTHLCNNARRTFLSSNQMEKAPTENPPFTLSDLKNAIPPHCFHRSLLKSFSFLVSDLSLAALLLYSTSFFATLPAPLRVPAWLLYWVTQGCILSGVWVIAHECGHHAFSKYQWIDDTVGLIIHSSLLVPYFSWKYSHRRHHSNTGSIERDEVFVPKTKPSLRWAATLLGNPAGRLLSIFIFLTMGWPLYLAFNASGREYPRFACHYDPYGPIFNPRERFQVFLSDLGILAVVFALCKLSSMFGLWWVVGVYGLPLMIVNGFLVTVTFLQHTHPGLPHYDKSEWDWLRGAVATVDRDYGVLNKAFHHITDTHVVHHLFSMIPHYHAAEATEAVKPILGRYYRFDSTPVCTAIWREFRDCMYVEPEEGRGVYWFRRK